MATEGMLIDYGYCSGCHSCELACRNELELPLEKWGIKLHENGPWDFEADGWEWDYVPVPTKLCDLCADRRARGEKAACELHCLAAVIEVGPIEELVKKMAGSTKKVLFTP